MKPVDFKKDLKSIISDVAELGNILWQKGWAERNAGNISVNITGLIDSQSQEKFGKQKGVPIDLENCYQEIAGQFFLVSISGSRMRDLAARPDRCMLIIRINDEGNAYHSIPLGPENKTELPTSELSTHLAIHNQLIKLAAKERVVMHTHPTELISLTQISKFCDEKALNDLFWNMHPETIMFMPEGAGFLSFLLPGSKEIAAATVDKFSIHKVVIWEKHGCFAIGKDVFDAFDKIDMLAKAASIYFQCKSSGHEPEGIPEAKLAELKELSKKYRDA